MESEELKQFIQDQGWSMFGITDSKTIQQNLKKHEIVFDEWAKKGYQADMSYLLRMEEDRYHPDHVLADVKSVIVLGAWYAGTPSRLRRCSPSLEGEIARYARGRDYHKVLKKKLIELSEFLKSKDQNTQTYTSVDSGPTVDRVLAESAGLGFFGKNTCIIDPSKGSYFFIACVLTNLDLGPTSKKSMPNCGNCQNCLKSCPIGALVEPGKLDARKCISYLTIENKEGIPEKLRPKIKNRLFGCDSCQEVCPFNKGRAHHQVIRIERLKGEYGAGESLDLREILSIKTDEEFLKKFTGTPLMRAKRKGLIRNACVVAGNSKDKSLIPYLKKVTKREPDDILKEHASWAIQQLSKTNKQNANFSI